MSSPDNGKADKAAPTEGMAANTSTAPKKSVSSTSASSPKGFARIGLMRKIVNGIVKRSRLEISSLHISQPDSSGLCAKGKIRLSHLGTGPFPLVGLKVKFKDTRGASLHWLPQQDGSAIDRGSKRKIDESLVQIHIKPLTLQPSTPGSVSSEVDMDFVLQDETQPAFVEFVKHMVRSDPKAGTRLLLRASNVQVKAFGLRFGGLQIEKEVVLGGLGCLGGALVFADEEEETQREGRTATSAATGIFDKKSTTSKSLSPRRWNLKRGASAADGFEKVATSPTAGKENGQAAAPASPSINFKHSPLTPTSKRLEISNLDITSGDASKGIQVSADVTIENPAREPELIIEPGELRFDLCIRDEEDAKRSTKDRPKGIPRGLIKVGVLALAPMTLKPGPNKVHANGFLLLPSPPQAEAETDKDAYISRAYNAGQHLIARIMQNERVDMCAVAAHHEANDPLSGVSNVGWLAAAFEGTRIDARIPPLGEKVRILDGAEVRVEGTDSTGATSPTSSLPSDPSLLQGSVARTTLRNGFDADIRVFDLSVRACSAPLIDDEGNVETLELGKLSSPKTDWRGLVLRRGEPTHVSLPMQINPDPLVLIEILRKSARSRNVDLGNPLTQLLEDLRTAHWTEAGFQQPPRSRPASSRGSRRTSVDVQSMAERPSEAQGEREPSDDLAKLLSSALANLRVTAYIEAEAAIGEFKIPGKLKFEQRNLPIALSTATAAALLPLVGKPFVKAMIDRAEVEVENIDVQRMDDRGIQANIAISLVNFGPLSATAVFDEGLHLREKDGEGRTLAIILFDGPISVIAGNDKPVTTEARIVPASGPEASQNFSNFVATMLQAKEVTFSALADPIGITSGGVEFRASLEKLITVNGFAGFAGLRMNDLQILGETSAPAAGVSMSVAAPANASQPAAISFSAIAELHNSGDMRLRLVKLEVAVLVDDVQIGQASIDDADLRPSATMQLKTKGVLYAPPSREAVAHKNAVEKMGKLIESLLAGKETEVKVKGRRAWVQDASGKQSVSLAWLDKALQTFETTAIIQWKGGVSIVTGIDVNTIDATFAARKGMQLRIGEVMAQYQVPFPIQFELQSIDASMDIVFGGKSIAKCHAVQESIENVERLDQAHQSQASSHSPRSPSGSSPSSSTHRKSSNAASLMSSGQNASGRTSSTSLSVSAAEQARQNPAKGQVKLALKEFDLDTQDDDLLGQMISHVVQAGPDGTDRITLRGVAHTSVKTVLGILRLDIPLGIEHKLDISGLDGLRNSPLHYQNFDIVSANPKFLQITMDINTHNPSEGMTIYVPDSSLSLSAYYQDAFVGDVIIGADGKGITLPPGPIHLPGVEFHYRPTVSSEPKAREIISQLFMNKSVNLSIRGHKRSAINRALSQALQIVDVPIEIAALGRNDLLRRIKVQLGLTVVTSNSIDATYALDNPTGLPIDVLHLDVQAFYNGKPFGTAIKTYSKDGTPTGRILGNTPSTQPKDSPSAEGGSGLEGAAAGGGQSASSSGRKSMAEESRRTSTSSSTTRLRRLLIAPHAQHFESGLVVKLSQPLDQLVRAFLHERGSIVLDVTLIAKLDIQGFVIPHFEYQQKVPLDVSGLQGVARLLRLI